MPANRNHFLCRSVVPSPRRRAKYFHRPPAHQQPFLSAKWSVSRLSELTRHVIASARCHLPWESTRRISNFCSALVLIFCSSCFHSAAMRFRRARCCYINNGSFMCEFFFHAVTSTSTNSGSTAETGTLAASIASSLASWLASHAATLPTYA